MEIHDKGARGDSYEGAGLSVSTCPDAWEEIARLGGLPWWNLSANPPPTFLDWHALRRSSEHVSFMALVRSWAIGEGLAQPSLAYRLSHFDEESGMACSFTFWSARQAQEELKSMDDPSARVSVMDDALKLTSVGLQKSLRQTASADEGEELCTLLYLDHLKVLDGVYWDEDLDPSSLSAPRAVVLPSRLERFHFVRLDRHQHRWREGIGPSMT
jgi:hypothetical protein